MHMPANIGARAEAFRVFLVHTAGGARALLPPDLARVVGSGVEAAILAYLATSRTLPEQWVNVDREALAASLGTSVHNVRRALGRLSLSAWPSRSDRSRPCGGARHTCWST